MRLPISDPNHILFGKVFSAQCNTIIETDDYCQIFGVTRPFSSDEIKQAYKQLSKHFHPDKHPNESFAATKAMQKINIAKAFFDDQLENLGLNAVQTQFNNTSYNSPVDDFINRINEWTQSYQQYRDRSIPLNMMNNNDLLSSLFWCALNDECNSSSNNSYSDDNEDGNEDGNEAAGSAPRNLGEIIEEIKSRVTHPSMHDNIYHQILFPSGYTLLRIVVKFGMTDFFEWLLDNIQNIETQLTQQDNTSFVYALICNTDTSARDRMYRALENIPAVQSTPEILIQELLRILRARYINDEVFHFIIDKVPPNYLKDHAAEIQNSNPQFLFHQPLFADTTKQKKIILKALHDNPNHYCNLPKNDKKNPEYIIYTFLQPHGRSSQVARALPFTDLPKAFIIAMINTWPDLDAILSRNTKLDTRIDDEYIYRDTAYNLMKRSGSLKSGNPKRIAMLLMINATLITAYSSLIFHAPKAVLHLPTLVLASAIILLSAFLIKLAYEIYQWNNIRYFQNKITFFKNNPFSNDHHAEDKESHEFLTFPASGV